MTRTHSRTLLVDVVDEAQVSLNIEVSDADEMRAEAIAEAYASNINHLLHLATRLEEAAAHLPDDSQVTPEEMALVKALENEVDSCFGVDARLYGRAVALYAVRDLAR